MNVIAEVQKKKIREIGIEKASIKQQKFKRQTLRMSHGVQAHHSSHRWSPTREEKKKNTSPIGPIEDCKQTRRPPILSDVLSCPNTDLTDGRKGRRHEDSVHRFSTSQDLKPSAVAMSRVKSQVKCFMHGSSQVSFQKNTKKRFETPNFHPYNVLPLFGHHCVASGRGAAGAGARLIMSHSILVYKLLWGQVLVLVYTYCCWLLTPSFQPHQGPRVLRGNQKGSNSKAPVSHSNHITAMDPLMMTKHLLSLLWTGTSPHCSLPNESGQESNEVLWLTH